MKLSIAVHGANGKSLYCKIVLRSLNSGTEQYQETVYCGGDHIFDLKKGTYQVAVFRGKLYKPYSERIKLGEREELDRLEELGERDDCGLSGLREPRELGEFYKLAITLKEIVDPKTLGLYSFDAHSHVSRDDTLKTGDLLTASTIMRAEGFDFFFAGSPYDNETHMEYINRCFPKPEPYRERFAGEISRANGESFMLDIGNEMIKCRYGHVFMMNFLQKPPFSQYFDHAFDPWLFEKIGDEPPYEIDYIYKAAQREKGGNSVAIAAHPTSWWWHDNGEFITNIAATLGFELLAGSIDAMVVMGYRSDHEHYQKLWFDALLNGYFLPGVAETDAAFDAPPSRFLEHKTYTEADAFTIDALCLAIKAGRNLVSSGPLLSLRVDGKRPGDVLPWAPQEQVLIEISAIACCEALLSKVQIIINGEVHKEFHIRKERYSVEETVCFPKEGFVIAKCYDFAGNVAMTNPVYIRNEPFVNRGYKANVRIATSQGGQPAKGFYWVGGGEKCTFEEKINLKIKVCDDIHIQVGGEVKTLRLFELPELQEIFKNLYFGRFNEDMRYMPGEVPPEAFCLKRIKKILDSVQISVEFKDCTAGAPLPLCAEF